MGKEGQQETRKNEQGIRVGLENDDIYSIVWWWDGGMVEWWNGTMVQWIKNSEMVKWRYGDMARQYILRSNM